MLAQPIHGIPDIFSIFFLCIYNPDYGDVPRNLALGERRVFTLNLDIVGIDEGSSDVGHVCRTFNNRIFIILLSGGILSRGNFFYHGGIGVTTTDYQVE